MERNVRKFILIDLECNDYLMFFCFIGVVNYKKFMFLNKVVKWNMKFFFGISKNRLYFNIIIIYYFFLYYVLIIDDLKFFKYFFIGIVV